MHKNVVVIGAGAAGMMCASIAGKRGRSVMLIEHSATPGEKIRISGGGRCNFTNIHASPDKYISANPHFCISALRRYTPKHFIALVDQYKIAHHEKTLGQLFCDDSAQQIIQMLLDECAAAKVELRLRTNVAEVEKTKTGFTLKTSIGIITCDAVVIASGGLSIPKMGATPFGYKIAEQFGHNIMPTRAGLVPLTFDVDLKEKLGQFTGLSVEAIVTCNKKSFREALLFTHRGLSGPVILQISSYWHGGDKITVNMAPDQNAMEFFNQQRDEHPKQDVATVLAKILPKRLASFVAETTGATGRIAETGNKILTQTAAMLNNWQVQPNGTEGYRTAEVTLGGVDTHELSSQTMQSQKNPGLYFIGEVVDVTGHLGGYNFQWAWASAVAAGQAV